ncbi:MAG: hydroxymethylpyrimidine/phosphomethylpyrimidine kinase, partial [Acidobacteriota bacterium]|nr:hydroxymethylpyrimidine/phosphomethylpyrimidine kinase [Acidobacteriota bacterium]
EGLVSPVVDPVVRSTSGYDLIDDDAVSALVAELLPRARVVTPNIPEAERITGLTIKDEEGMRKAALAIRQLGARAVVIKGGHLNTNSQNSATDLEDGPMAIDLLDDNGRVIVVRGEWIENATTHGTGCMFSAAIAACLGHAMGLEESVRNAKSYVAGQIRAQLGTKR